MKYKLAGASAIVSAAGVREWLDPLNRMSTISFGDTLPAATNDGIVVDQCLSVLSQQPERSSSWHL
jgi:hypothetical protein